MCYALIQQGSLDGNRLHGSADTYAFLIRELLPSGLKGLMAAALLAAVMSSVSGAVNSIGTLVSYDLLKHGGREQVTAHWFPWDVGPRF